MTYDERANNNSITVSFALWDFSSQEQTVGSVVNYHIFHQHFFFFFLRISHILNFSLRNTTDITIFSFTRTFYIATSIYFLT